MPHTQSHSVNAKGALSTVNNCALCGVLLTSHGENASSVCQSISCRMQAAALPAHRKCAVCETPIVSRHWPRGVCDLMACQIEYFVSRPRRAAEARRAREIETALTSRRRSAAQRGMSALVAESYPVALLPLNTDQSSVLPAHRRNTFAQHVRTNLAEARVRVAAGERVTEEHVTSAVLGESAQARTERLAQEGMLQTACAVCRGRCCQWGGNHAFNTPDTMVRYLQQHPEHDDDTIVNRYLGHIGTRTMTHGCVYQHELGCTLPGELRSNSCHQYLCDGLRMIKDACAPGQPVRAFFVQIKDGRTMRRAFVSVSET